MLSPAVTAPFLSGASLIDYFISYKKKPIALRRLLFAQLEHVDQVLQYACLGI